jgi:hypothetical protein
MLKKGDTLIFNKLNCEDNHFKNFQFGKSYKVSKVELVSLGSEDPVAPCMAVMFENSTWGCYLHQIDKYFISDQDKRDNILKDIL